MLAHSRFQLVILAVLALTALPGVKFWTFGLVTAVSCHRGFQIDSNDDVSQGPETRSLPVLGRAGIYAWSMPKYQCVASCSKGGVYDSLGALNKHRAKCPHAKRHSKIAHQSAFRNESQEATIAESSQNARLSGNGRRSRMVSSSESSRVQNVFDVRSSSPLSLLDADGLQIQPEETNDRDLNHGDVDIPMDVDPEPPALEEPANGGADSVELTPAEVVENNDGPADPLVSEGDRRRGTRQRRLTQKVRDMLPEGPRIIADSPTPDISAADEDVRTVRRVILRVTETVQTAANAFGLWREYKGRPTSIPDADGEDIQSVVERNVAAHQPEKNSRSILEIISPFPNISTWRLRNHFWTNPNPSSLASAAKLQKEVLGAPDYNNDDVIHVNLESMDKKMSTACFPWEDPAHGWRESSVKITVPMAQKETKSSKRKAAAAARRHAMVEDSDDSDDAEQVDPSSSSGKNEIFDVPGFSYRPIVQVIKSVFAKDEAAKDFHYQPFRQFWQPPKPGALKERVYDELYTSDAWNNEHEKLLNSPREPGCNLPRAIAGLMFWSDATHVAQFGQAKLWPIYMAFGNQSKYVRSKPGARAAHHMGYLPSLPDFVQDFIRTHRGGKGASAPLMAHCRRELFHAAWSLLLDKDFIEAYKHGIVIDCVDGIRRRIYPRIFTYSADYPEKVLIASIRDMGGCPCPRCLVTKVKAAELATTADMRTRIQCARTDDATRREKVQTARSIIYDKGYVVNSTNVEDVLKPESLVPTVNAFSAALSPCGFDFFSMLVVDFLHEVELGLLKNVFVHFIRILGCFPNVILELNHRYRQVPSFGQSTIRSFPHNVGDMKKLAARDFEDIMQCAFPCFEGLLPEPYNSAVLDIIYIINRWHAFAKLRMQTDSTLLTLDKATVALGKGLRSFRDKCNELDIRETQKEANARGRVEARRAAQNPQSAASSPVVQPGLKEKTLNLHTYRMHALGDYPAQIRIFGTTDSTSTQSGEHEHRRLKARYKRVSKNKFTNQIVKVDIRENEFRRMEQELREAGVWMPAKSRAFSTPKLNKVSVLDASERYHIAKDQKTYYYLPDWLSGHDEDPALKNFIPNLKDHLLSRIEGRDCADEDLTYTDEDRATIIFEGHKIYHHQTVRFNYTTYDVRREQDVVNVDSSKRFVMLASRADEDVSASGTKFWYAQVLRVFHANIVHMSGSQPEPQRMDFLWVRWLGADPDWAGGLRKKRYDRVGFVPNVPGEFPFGFLDPANVVRGCHLIPTFASRPTFDLLGPSLARDEEGDWEYFYVNEVVDRDMMMRYFGLGIGHVNSEAIIEQSLNSLRDAESDVTMTNGDETEGDDSEDIDETGESGSETEPEISDDEDEGDDLTLQDELDLVDDEYEEY